MLIALAIVLFGLGGDSAGIWLFPEDFADRIEAVIVDENRQSEIIDLFDKISESVISYNDRVKEIAENASMLNRNPDATERDFEQIVQILLKERKMIQKEVLDARLNMSHKCNQNEWRQVFAVDSVINNN
jgi:hypothetical protein